VNPELMGMTKVVSEDSVRRAWMQIGKEEGEEWLRRQLVSSYEPLLEEPWALDLDATVKPLYGHQEDARVGYNPSKPGRPSHVYHTYLMANVRIVLAVEVQAGNQTAAAYAQPGLWALLDGLERSKWPAFLRGDCQSGTEAAMAGAERRQLAYVFKLKQSANVKRLIGRVMGRAGWVEAGQGWQGMEEELRLQGWRVARRVIVLRRPLRAEAAEKKERREKKAGKQLVLDLPEVDWSGVRYEYAVLVTSLGDEVRAIAQHYRDRGDAENNFDELKNQWAQPPDDGGGDEPACPSRAHGRRAQQGERLPAAYSNKCGAVDPSRSVAAHSQHCFSIFSSWQGSWKYRSAG
jgi:hypothetical protein